MANSRWLVSFGLMAAWSCTMGGGEAVPKADPGAQPIAGPAGNATGDVGGGASAVPGSSRSLIGPEWRVTQIGARAITLDQVQVEPYLVFEPQGARHRVAGSAGCNRLAGGYRVRGPQGIEFEDLVGTEMGCERGQDVEQALSDALQTVKSYRIVGRALELLDGGGRVAVRLEAR